MRLAKAVLSDDQDNSLEVQFNPETLTINHQTYGEDGRQRTDKESQGNGAVSASESSSRTGYSSNLSQVELFFDTTETGQDVREKTLLILEMMKPVCNKAPTITFQWGTLIFEGHINGFTETLTYFSDQGVPLRATANINLTAASSNRAANNITSANGGLGLSASASLGLSAGISGGISAGVSVGGSAGGSAGGSVGGTVGASVSAGLSTGASIGTTPLTFSQSGESLQSLSARAGLDWRTVAEANNIDNPRALQAGAVVNLNVGT